jgi:nitrogen regulatory protein P-II 2
MLSLNIYDNERGRAECRMKLIIAMIRPEKLAAVQAALTEQEACLMSVSEVLGDGREPGCTGMYRGVEFRVQRPKLRLEIAVDDWVVEGAVETIMRAGSTSSSGQIGDCKVFVMQLDWYVASPTANDDRWSSQYEVEDPWRL